MICRVGCRVEDTFYYIKRGCVSAYHIQVLYCVADSGVALGPRVVQVQVQHGLNVSDCANMYLQ